MNFSIGNVNEETSPKQKPTKNYGHVLSPEEECTALRGKFSALQRTYSLPLNIKLLSSRHFSENVSLPYQSLYMGF